MHPEQDWSDRFEDMTSPTPDPLDTQTPLRVVDLFAGIGGLRLGALRAAWNAGYDTRVVFTSEIKTAARAVLAVNYPDDVLSGDITSFSPEDIPDHDLLLAGFPCQAFSHAGKRAGFLDATRGTLFFNVAAILKAKQPARFVLENVEGLLTHDPDPEDRGARYGRTFQTILDALTELGYNVAWSLEEATQHGVPQLRRRVFIVGSLHSIPDLTSIPRSQAPGLGAILEENPPVEEDQKLADINRLLRARYGDDLNVLDGKIFRDWRGGERNLHSWDFAYKGEVTAVEADLLEQLMKQSKRKAHWRPNQQVTGEGVHLSQAEVETFFPVQGEALREMLVRLTGLGYLQQDTHGWKLSSGKLSLPVSHVLPRTGWANTLVATDADRLVVSEGDRLRRFTDVELRRLFGFPDDFLLAGLPRRKLFDLFGNSVVVPVATAVTSSLF